MLSDSEKVEFRDVENEKLKRDNPEYWEQLKKLDLNTSQFSCADDRRAANKMIDEKRSNETPIILTREEKLFRYHSLEALAIDCLSGRSEAVGMLKAKLSVVTSDLSLAQKTNFHSQQDMSELTKLLEQSCVNVKRYQTDIHKLEERLQSGATAERKEDETVKKLKKKQSGTYKKLVQSQKVVGEHYEKILELVKRIEGDERTISNQQHSIKVVNEQFQQMQKEKADWKKELKKGESVHVEFEKLHNEITSLKNAAVLKDGRIAELEKNPAMILDEDYNKLKEQVSKYVDWFIAAEKSNMYGEDFRRAIRVFLEELNLPTHEKKKIRKKPTRAIDNFKA